MKEFSPSPPVRHPMYLYRVTVCEWFLEAVSPTQSTHLLTPCSGPKARAARPDCARQPAVRRRRPAGDGADYGGCDDGGCGGRAAGAGAAAATIAVLLRTVPVAAPWTCRTRRVVVCTLTRRSRQPPPSVRLRAATAVIEEEKTNEKKKKKKKNTPDGHTGPCARGPEPRVWYQRLPAVPRTSGDRQRRRDVRKPPTEPQ